MGSYMGFCKFAKKISDASLYNKNDKSVSIINIKKGRDKVVKDKEQLIERSELSHILEGLFLIPLFLDYATVDHKVQIFLN